jgi:hypothetical protein
MQAIPVFPDLPQWTETVTLGDAQFRLTFTWRERPRAWYLDIETLEGTPLASGRRLSPGWDVLYGLLPEAGVPAGHLFVTGPDPYEREQLGGDVQVIWMGSDEEPATPVQASYLVT